MHRVTFVCDHCRSLRLGVRMIHVEQLGIVKSMTEDDIYFADTESRGGIHWTGSAVKNIFQKENKSCPKNHAR